MAQSEHGPPSSQADQGSLHVLQLFDFSYTVLTFDDRLILYLRTAERANEKIHSARALLRGLGPEVSIPKKKSMERTISETEYNARILAQDLDPAKSESSSPQDIIRQSRLFLVLRPDNHEVSKDLESLHHACNALDNIIESCKSVRANSVKRKPLNSPVAPSSQTSPVASPPAINVNGVDAEQSSMSQQNDDFLKGLPPLDATRLLHHRRTSRLRNRSTSQLSKNNEGQSEQQANDPQQSEMRNDPTNAFELPGWPTPIPIPPPTARGYVFIPTLTTMPELEAPSEIISVTKAKPDYAASLRNSIIEPGVHQVQKNDDAFIQGASKAVALESTERVTTSNQSPEQAQPSSSDSKGLIDLNVAAPSLDDSTTPQDDANPHASLASPRNPIVQESDAQRVASHRSSTISERPQSLLSSAQGNESSASAILTPSTSISSRLSEVLVGKSSGTRNKLRKAPYTPASKSTNVHLADSSGTTANTTASKLSSGSQRHESHNDSSNPPPVPPNQSSQPTIRQVPSVSVKTKQLPDKVSGQAPVTTPPSTAQDATHTTNYTPTLTTSPQFQTTKSFTIVSPPVSPSREAFQKDYENSNATNSKRLSITSTTSAPPSTNYPPTKDVQSAYSTQQQINDGRDARLHQAQTRTYSLPEITQHRRNLSMNDRWLPQRSQTHTPETNTLQDEAYSSKLARESRDERIASPSNVPNTGIARAPIPPYPMTPIQGPVRLSHHESMPSVPTRIPFPQIQDPYHQPQLEQPLTQQTTISSSSVPSNSYRGSFRFQPPQQTTPGGAGHVPTTGLDPHRSFQPQPQPQTFQPTPTLPQNATPSMEQHPMQPDQPQPRYQSVRFPQLQQQRQQQAPNTIHTPAPPLPPKINQPPTIPEADLHRERSVSGTKSTISSRSSTLGQHSQQQQHPPSNFRSTSSSTLSAGVGIVGDGGGGGGSSTGSTLGAGPAVGMARKRSSWLTRQVERAGLKSF